MRVSVSLAAKADGSKMKPMIVFEGGKREVNKLNETFRSKCIIASSSNASMNEDLTKISVEKIVGKFSFGSDLLLGIHFHVTTWTL